ncbi:arrestin domain-containing protein 17 [Apis mellifera caucasica]|nr:arrestin domain-containing protein 17 [Apis mellifera caucasica]
MPSLKTFRVEFDRPTATYLSGETVSGNIIVDIVREKEIRGLFFIAIGQANVSWTEYDHTRKKKHHSHNVIYSNSEKYFEFKYNIIAKHKSNSRMTIPFGYHEYPFNFQLPHNIPSSFEHKYGHVRYTIKVVMDRPWRFDHQTKIAFTVISTLDLNAHREKCLGLDDEMIKNFFSCCCNQGSINLQIRIPSSGYVPGQSIITMMNYVNSTNNIQITKISTKLLQKLKFYASTPHTRLKSSTVEIATKDTSESYLARGQAISEMLIPPIPPSYLEYCSIIDLSYELLVTVHVSGLHFKMKKSYPLLIGTIPLYHPPSAPSLDDINASTTISFPIPTPGQFDRSHLPPEAIGFVSPEQSFAPSNHLDIPPPSYKECMFGTEDIMDQDDSKYVFGADMPWAPRYPVFNYPKTS